MIVTIREEGFELKIFLLETPRSANWSIYKAVGKVTKA